MAAPSPDPLAERKHPLLENDCNQVPSLLTLSREDLTGKPQNDNHSRESDDSLLLMQLPSCVKVKDLGGARIVAPADRQACLVIEKSGKSFAISRVDTSNALVLVPPCQSSTPMEPISQSPPPTKRAKTTNLLPIHARLLQPGGSESSFLELKDHVLDVTELKQQLEDFVFAPHSHNGNTWTGRTLQELALTMRCSEKQIIRGLAKIGAFGMPREDSPGIGYGFLSEEATQQALQAMIATLTECDEFMEFHKSPISVESLTKETTKRIEMDEDSTYPQIQYVVRHCLKSLVDSDSEHDETTVKLDFNKVARHVAHGVFQAQSEAWEEPLFLARWHSVLPSVDQAPSMDLLTGIAIEITTLSGDRRWKYFPHDKLSSDPKERFHQLFAVKERWSLEQISPYLQVFVEELGMNQSQLLTLHAKAVKEEVDGVSTKCYSKL